LEQVITVPSNYRNNVLAQAMANAEQKRRMNLLKGNDWFPGPVQQMPKGNPGVPIRTPVPKPPMGHGTGTQNMPPKPTGHGTGTEVMGPGYNNTAGGPRGFQYKPVNGVDFGAPKGLPASLRGNPGMPVGGSATADPFNWKGIQQATDPYNWAGIAAALAKTGGSNNSSGGAVGNLPTNFSGSVDSGSVTIDPVTGIPTSTPESEGYLAPTPLDVDALYNALLAKVQGYGASSLQGFDEGKAQASGAYDQAAKALLDQYNQAKVSADEQANALGANKSIYNEWDANLGGIQANNESAKANTVNFFDKLKALKTDDNNSLYGGIESDRVAKKLEVNQAMMDHYIAWKQAEEEGNAKAAEAALDAAKMELEWAKLEMEAAKLSGASGSGGGGGSGFSRRGGSGGSSSGSGTTDVGATLTETLFNPNDMAIYQSLLESDPKAAETYIQSLFRTMGSPVNQDLQKQADAENLLLDTKAQQLIAGIGSNFNKPKTTNQATNDAYKKLMQNVTGAKNKVVSGTQKQKEQQAAWWRNVIASSLAGSGISGNPQQRVVVTSKGKEKIKPV
jgi:hypothetical protein